MSHGLPTHDDYTFPFYVYFSQSKDAIMCRVDREVQRDINKSENIRKMFFDEVYDRISQNATADNVVQFVPQRAATWKEFMPITAQNKEEVGIGVKIRVWSEGEAILTDPKCVVLTTNSSA